MKYLLVILRLIPFLLFAACSHSHPGPTPSQQETLVQIDAISREATAKAPHRPVACLDALGLGDSPTYCQNLATAITEPLMLGAFLNEDGFGSSLACVTHLVDLGKVNAVRFEGDFRDDHICAKSAAENTKRSKDFAGVRALAGRVPVRASGQCEHSCDSRSALDMERQLSGVCPGCRPINVPLLSRRGAVVGANNECHGNEVCGNGSSLDGTDPDALNYITWKAQRSAQDYVCIWDHVLNRKTSAGDRTPRGKRRRIPTVAELRELIRMAR